MAGSIEDQVVDFYHTLFEQVFSERFRPQISERIRRNAVIRQVEESADAASQSLTRFFRNEQLTELQTADILSGFAGLPSLLKFETIANPNIAPESVVEDLLTKMPCTKAIRQARQDAVYRVALHSVVQVLMLVGRVMAEWERLRFSSTFELPRRVVEQLNLISEQLSAVRGSGLSAKDERFELTYRDYLLQRFHRVEAGTVRMTTSMDVDLRELFVMPRVLARPQRKKKSGAQAFDPTTPMNLAAARAFFGGIIETDEKPESKKKKKADGIRALSQIKRNRRNVIIGLPGSGKSTLFEWLQLKIAAVEVEYILGGSQAIPLLLRVRQLNPKKLPTGAAMIEKATASKDRAALMPKGWFERQMQAGRVLFLLDGLDETEPELCDNYILPWLVKMCAEYPNCAYLVSSRPVGYPPGALQPFKFKECDLMDFGEVEIAEYARHWCTAIRLARNEPEAEARREGTAEGEQIVTDFRRNSYVQNLARNPLMLSAICLVNNFERGQLPEDRAVLYKLCVEGLLHNWDQRRGIRSEFTLEEKLRACREVALAMQAEDRAEYETKRVQKIFSVVLGDPDRADNLLEHIRYRTGLLIERRAGMFAFAHLTFQEYLAAKAIYEGNRMNIDAKRLADEHNDGRWKEVIAILPNQRIHLIKPKEIKYAELGKQEAKDKMTWGLKQLGIPELWKKTKNQGKGIKVAVLDTGVYGEHPALAGRVKDFIVIDPLGRRIASKPTFDCGSHGTHVCGTIAGNDASGVAIGVAPEATLFVAGVLVGEATLHTLMEGISWAIEKGVDIINMSLGFSYYEPLFAEVFKMLIEQYHILPVVAIGNENHGNSSSPGNAYNAFSVGAVEKMPGNKLDVPFFSSGASLVFPGAEQGTRVDKPDIVAPGVQVFSRIPPERTSAGTFEYSYFDGTSMATPHIAGVAALLMAAKPQTPILALINALKVKASHPNGDGGRPDNRWGYGVVQPLEALNAL